VVPGDWKLANVSPIYKGKGGSDNVANYRPISVTNCFIKILEKIIFKHLHTYLLRYNILSDDQSGFRHRDSTINQLLVIYDVIMKNKLIIYLLFINDNARQLTRCKWGYIRKIRF
jgi:hypothetical protein